MTDLMTERLILRPMCTDYLDSTHEYASDPETCKYMVFLPNDTTAETLGYLKRAEKEFAKDDPSFYEMAVFLGDTHIGAVSLYLNDARTEGELGWTINKRYQGCGYACEAAKALINYAAVVLGIKHFIAHCDTENAPSRRVMEKLGMTLKDEYGGRKNKLSEEERREYLFRLDHD
ncbi:MAG: GNAT family N-acetyltransferase [Ruminococcus sp.]|nr:GNAT family N-acetyltransferase [Ruminococcus sp.]